MTRMQTEELNIPEKNPDVGKPATTRGRKAKSRKVAGTSLVPDLSSIVSGATKQYAYWVGVTPSCPVEHIDLAGINFPKVNELIVADPLRTNQKRRVPVIGSIVWLTKDRLELMQERLRRTVIRFYEDAGQKDEPGTGQNVGDNHVRPRRGQLITIPSDEQIQQAGKANRAIRRYVPQSNDVPAARFMFAELCSDQVKGNRGEVYPEPLEVTGLDWPEDLEN
jgi:hypothetical protein